MVALCGGGWTLRRYAFGIGMTTTLLGHPMSVTRHYFNHEQLYNFIRVVVNLFTSFQLIECDVYA